jgi:uncharacterized membrane protein YccF (DUF307 family)
VVEQPSSWLTKLTGSESNLGSGTKLAVQLFGEISVVQWFLLAGWNWCLVVLRDRSGQVISQ